MMIFTQILKWHYVHFCCNWPLWVFIRIFQYKYILSFKLQHIVLSPNVYIGLLSLNSARVINKLFLTGSKLWCSFHKIFPSPRIIELVNVIDNNCFRNYILPWNNVWPWTQIRDVAIEQVVAQQKLQCLVKKLSRFY